MESSEIPGTSKAARAKDEVETNGNHANFEGSSDTELTERRRQDVPKALQRQNLEGKRQHRTSPKRKKARGKVRKKQRPGSDQYWEKGEDEVEEGDQEVHALDRYGNPLASASAAAHEEHQRYMKQNSPEVVKIKVDLLESLKGNLESLKENLQDTVELEEEGSGSDGLALAPSESERRGSKDERPGGSFAGEFEGGNPRSGYGPAESLSQTTTTVEKSSAAGSGRRRVSRQIARRSSAPVRYSEEGEGEEVTLAPVGVARGWNGANDRGAGRGQGEEADASAPETPQLLSSAAAEDGEEDVSPTYLVHENQVLPIGFPKKKQTLFKVSSDSPPWFQSNYKNKNKNASTGKDARVGGPPQAPQGDGEDSQGQFYIPGGKQKVECRYVTQVSDSSPDWFRSKYSSTRGHYHPMNDERAPSREDDSKVGDKGQSSRARKLSFIEDSPL